MKTAILRYYRENALGRNVLSIPIRLYKSLMDKFLSDEAWCRSMFKWTHGYSIDLDSPRTLNEKIQWLKLYNRRPEYTNWADKYKVRDQIRDILGEQYLVPLLAVDEDPRQIDFDSLPAPFIIKSTHSSGQARIVRDKNEMNWPSVVKECRAWLKSNLYRYGREWHYKNIPPRIIVERLLVDDEGNIPFDYKFHCIHGRIAAVQVDLDRQTNHRRNFYDQDWKCLPFTWSVCVGDRPLWPQGRDVERPGALSELIALTKKLAEKFLYVRIDWYVLGERIYFGEVTFHHGGGFERILPFEWDKRLAEKLQLPQMTSRRPGQKKDNAEV